MKTKITFLAILCSLFSFAQVGTIFTAGGINYTITTATTVEVAQNPTTIGAIVIPETVSYDSSNYAVTSIGSYAFKSGLISITIPNSVTSIGRYAFYGCTGLTSVIIPNAVTSIADSTFMGCSGLTAVSIPNSVTSIEYGAFYSCTSLTSVSIPCSVTSIGQAAFAYCYSLTSVTIPSGVTSIGKGAFYLCYSLTSVTIPSSVTSIGEGAFSGCDRLLLVNVGWTIPVSINSNTFGSLINISTRTLNVPTGTETIYKSTLVWKDFYTISEPVAGLVQVGQKFVVNGINYFVRKSILPYEVAVYENKDFVGTATIPSTVSYTGNVFAVTAIGNLAFNDCKSLTAVTIPNSVKSIGIRAFQSCTALTQLTIPNSVTTIDAAAFSDSGLTSVSIPNSITSTGKNLFWQCASLTSVSLPNSITSITAGTFDGCKSLTSITIPDSVNTIESAAFQFSGLTSITLPNSLISIGEAAFRNCIGLNSIIIPNSVTKIADFAFGICTGLKSITIPNTVNNIARGFYGCTGLQSVTVNWTTPLAINRNVFDKVTLAPITLNVPLGTVTAYKTADVWKEFGTIIEYVAPVVGQKIVIDGINYIVTKATLPYEVAVATDNQGSSGRFTNAAQTGISGAVIIPATISSGGNSFSVTSILAAAFQNNKGITAVTIPSSVISIGDYAFSNCTVLSAVTVNWTTPIGINATVFDGVPISNVELRVPAGTENTYKSAAVWKDFGVIATLSTNSFTTNNTVKFYPNPTQSQINFSQEINTLDVFDIAGKKVKSFHNPTTNYDVATLQKGVYVLKGKTTDGKSINEKLVKE